MDSPTITTRPNQRGIGMVKKSVAELVVIVCGVVIGLAADRWLKTVDTKTAQSNYVSGLIEDLRADSISFESKIANADSAANQALELLLFVDGEALPVNIDTARFIRRVITLSYYTPSDFARETWDDLVAKDKMEAIPTDSLRTWLSRYYHSLDRLSAIERDWEAQLAAYELGALATQSPMVRLTMLGDSGVPEHVRKRHDTKTVALEQMRNAIRSNPELYGALGQARIIRTTSKRNYERYLGGASRILSMLEQAR